MLHLGCQWAECISPPGARCVSIDSYETPRVSMATGGGDSPTVLTCDPQVALVFPNNDPAAFMASFYGCLLAEVVPVPIEVPLSRKVRPHFDLRAETVFFMHKGVRVCVYLYREGICDVESNRN